MIKMNKDIILVMCITDQVGRGKIFINGWEYWIDVNKRILYDSETSKNGIYFDIYGEHDSIGSSHLTKDEKRQILEYIKYGR